MQFEFTPFNKAVTDEELISDVKAVAKALNKTKLTMKEYDQHGRCNSSTIIRRFETWNTALRLADIEITNQIYISRENLFQNILKLWMYLGRQPRRVELELTISDYSQQPYNREFGGWNNALRNFVEWANQEEVEKKDSTEKETFVSSRLTGRDPSLRLRFKVMRRDNFTCVQCGASPAKSPDVELHIDHIKPWSLGGATIYENLQTLCLRCNLGKSNLEY